MLALWNTLFKCPIVFRAGGHDNVSITVDRVERTPADIGDSIQKCLQAIGPMLIITKITPISGSSEEIINSYRYLLEWIAVVR